MTGCIGLKALSTGQVRIILIRSWSAFWLTSGVGGFDICGTGIRDWMPVLKRLRALSALLMLSALKHF